MQGLDWNDLRVVLAAARTGSFAGAARRLGVNESTVARRIAQAERRLGVRIFERNLGVLQATQAGNAVVGGAERVEREVQDVTAAVGDADRQVAGSVRLTSVPIVVNRLLVPALAQLLPVHPQLQVELIAEPRDLSLYRRDADVALRLARPRRESGALTRRLGRLDYAIYAAQAAAAGSLAWVTYEDGMTDVPQRRWIDAAARRDGRGPARVLVNDAEAILQAVAAGLGKSLLPTAVGEREPGLVRHGPAVVLSRELWLMVHPRLRDLARVRAVLDWLESVAATWASPADRSL